MSWTRSRASIRYEIKSVFVVNQRELTVEQYASTCVALLSTTLESPRPSKAPILITKCLEKAIESLSSETVRPVYLLLSGIESRSFEILPFNVLSSVQSRTIEVLSELDSDNHLGNLSCLAILARFSSRPGVIKKSLVNAHSSPNDAIEPEPTDIFSPARKFFSSRKTLKILDLVVIKAIKACSQRCQLNANDIVESLKLSREIVDALDKKERSSWLAGNNQKTKKLYEKILRPDIENKVQCEVSRRGVLAFYWS